MTGRGRINHLLSPFQAEVIACLQGIQTALNLGIGKLILETDALLIKQALASTEVCDRPEEGLVNELKFLEAVRLAGWPAHSSKHCSCEQCFHIE